jgi:hypothetical protein
MDVWPMDICAEFDFFTQPSSPCQQSFKCLYYLSHKKATIQAHFRTSKVEIGALVLLRND